jgi:HAD superfamily hydrolase (TIGR01509 family)
VLVDSEPLHSACWAEVLAPFGPALEWDYYREHYIGLDDRDMIRDIAGRAGLQWETLWAQYPKKKELFSRRMQHPPFHPQLGKLLESLHREYRLAVVSSSARSEIEPPLEAGGLRQYFEAMVTGGDAPRHKPAPDPYLMAARLVSSKSPLVVEDSEPGIASGRAAGFEVLAVNASEMPELLMRFL